MDDTHTRVAVVVFSSQTSSPIEGLTEGMNKCGLMTSLLQLASLQPSGYTATGPALQKVLKLLENSRTTAKKAVVVITDGRSNIGSGIWGFLGVFWGFCWGGGGGLHCWVVLLGVGGLEGFERVLRGLWKF